MDLEKPALLKAGIALAERFCVDNMFPMPEVVTPEVWKHPRTCGYYRKGVIHVRLPLCATVGRAGRSWSWPGYPVDRTPYGVVLHEFGHHVDFTLSGVKKKYAGDFGVVLCLASGERALTGYAPNEAEWFAEIFKLYLSNPDLLRQLRPKAFAGLSSLFKAPITTGWRETLEAMDAPVRTIAAARNRIHKEA